MTVILKTNFKMENGNYELILYYLRYYYANQCFHNRFGINQLMLVMYSDDKYINSHSLSQIFTVTFSGMIFYHATQGLFHILQINTYK